MRINVYLASATGVSRRQADKLIQQGRVSVNGATATIGGQVGVEDVVLFDSKAITLASETTTIMLNKPVGYVVSRSGQGARTIYDLLPGEFRPLKPVGRLDKDSSGLLLLTNDGQLANSLTHPSNVKLKRYQIELNKALAPSAIKQITEGVMLSDGISRLNLNNLAANSTKLTLSMSEGRNRQIRRTFAALGYAVIGLHRTNFGEFSLDRMGVGEWRKLKP